MAASDQPVNTEATLDGGLADFGDLTGSIELRCVVGSRAQGLATAASDTDRRGMYLAPAALLWSLDGAPEQLESTATEECYWELEKFLKLALKANPNVLECLYIDEFEVLGETGRALVEARDAFLSKRAYETFGSYARHQLRRAENARKRTGEVRWKPVMHLLRLLISGATLLRDGRLNVDVGANREELLAVKTGQRTWEHVDAWRTELLADLDAAHAASTLPDEPDRARAESLLLLARRRAAAVLEDSVGRTSP